MPASTPPALVIKLRVLHEGIFAFGPGKAELLEAIDRSGSILGAGKELNFSYSKTRRLVNEMNESFKGPLVASSRGGQGRGGAALTPVGRAVLAVFRTMEAHAGQAVAKDFAKLRTLMKKT